MTITISVAHNNARLQGTLDYLNTGSDNAAILGRPAGDHRA
jgi:hypothetical protein